MAFEPDEGLDEWQEDIFEHHTRKPFSGWPQDMAKASWYDVVSVDCMQYLCTDNYIIPISMEMNL